MSDAPDLLPCPFCGGAELKVFDNSVDCKSCGATGPDLGYCVGEKCRAEAISGWNRRADLAAADAARIAELEARLLLDGRARTEIALARDIALTNLEHWRQEVGKLHSRIVELERQLAEAREVKPLEWEPISANPQNYEWKAKKPFGSAYYIHRNNAGLYSWVAGQDEYGPLEAAKAAAQADYTARILSALKDPTP